MKRQKPKNEDARAPAKPKLYLAGGLKNRHDKALNPELENPSMPLGNGGTWPKIEDTYILADIPAKAKIQINGPCYIGSIGAGAQVYIVGGPVIVRENIGDNVTICVVEHDGQDPADWFKREPEPENNSLGRVFNRTYEAGKKLLERSPQSDYELMKNMSGIECRGQIGREVTIACFSHVDLGDTADIYHIKVIAGGDIRHRRGVTSSMLHSPLLKAGRDIQADSLNSCSAAPCRARLYAMRDITALFLASGTPVYMEARRNIKIKAPNNNPAELVAGQDVKFTKRPCRDLKALFNKHCGFKENIMTLHTSRCGVTEIRNKPDKMTDAELKRLIAQSRNNTRKAVKVNERFPYPRCVEIQRLGSVKAYFLDLKVTDSNVAARSKTYEF